MINPSRIFTAGRFDPNAHHPMGWVKKPLFHAVWLTYGQNEIDARVARSIQARLNLEAQFYARR